MVKVGNSECEFLKLTPLSRISAIAGAVCAVTMRPRRPSGTNRIRLRGLAFCADAEPAANAIRLADSNTIVRRIRFSPQAAVPAIRRGSRLVSLCDRIVTLCGTGLKSGQWAAGGLCSVKGWGLGPHGGNIGAPAPFSLAGGQP